jgi:hypothetical protein
MIMGWRDREWWLNFVFLGDGRVKHKNKRSEEMRNIIMRNWDWREYHVPVIWSSPIQQVWVIIWRIIPAIRGIVIPIRQVLSLILHGPSYASYHSHFHPPSLCLSSKTLPEHMVNSSLSISPCHHCEWTLTTAYTEYSLHRVQHRPKFVCNPIILTISSWPLNVAPASGVPPCQLTATSQFTIRTSKVKSPYHIPTVSS